MIPAKLGPSLAGGDTDRWYRRFRYYLQPKNYRPKRNAKTGPDLLTVEDYSLAFLLECLSLRDWLYKCPKFTKPEIAKLYSNYALRLCRDVANALKHRTPLTSASVDPNIRVERFGWPTSSGLVVVLEGGRVYDLVLLCQNCYEHLKKFFVEQGWDTPMLRLVPELGDFIGY